MWDVILLSSVILTLPRCIRCLFTTYICKVDRCFMKFYDVCTSQRNYLMWCYKRSFTWICILRAETVKRNNSFHSNPWSVLFLSKLFGKSFPFSNSFATTYFYPDSSSNCNIKWTYVDITAWSLQEIIYTVKHSAHIPLLEHVSKNLM